jgi:phage gp29-like protein
MPPAPAVIERSPGLISRAWGLGLAALGVSPTRNSSPEDDGTPPDLDAVYSQSPELTILGNSGPWMKAILAQNDDSILRREGAQDLRLFDRLLDDDVAMSNLQQRRLAITSRDWEVTPGDDKDPRSVKAGEQFKAMLKGLGFDRATGLLHYAIWYGYGVGEALWTTKVHEGARIIWLDDIVVPDRRWFGFTLEGELRFVGAARAFGGEEVPPNKFVTIRTGGTHDFAFYGLGLAHWVYWPVWFKRAALKFWALYLEKLANPTAVGEFKETDNKKTKRTLLETLLDIGRASAVLIPEGMVDKIKFMEAQRAGLASSSFKEFLKEQNEAIMRIVLGQPGSSSAQPQGLGSGQSEAHSDVKAEIVKADADLISEAINKLAKWVTRWNHGEDVAAPQVFRVLDDAEDLNKVAERDSKLDALGIERTDESVEQVYGEGYRRVPKPTPVLPGAPGQPGQRGLPAPANDRDPRETAAARRAAFAATDPVPLYVRRDLLNAEEFRRWAKKQGFEDLADDPHVTVLYTRTPVDPFSLGTDDWGGDATLTIAEGGPRKVEALGSKGAIVLHFASDRLRWRHEDMVRRGAVHKWEEFLPHVTITMKLGDVDLEQVEPYEGELRFGPERFAPIEVDPDPLSMFSAAEEDEIDRLTAALMDEANPVLVEFAAALKDGLAQAREDRGGNLSLEGARVALLQAWEQFPADRLARLTGLSFVAERAAAEAGAEDRVTA